MTERELPKLDAKIEAFTVEPMMWDPVELPEEGPRIYATPREQVEAHALDLHASGRFAEVRVLDDGGILAVTPAAAEAWQRAMEARRL